MPGKKRPPTDPKIAKFLENLRKESGFNKTEMAKAMGCSHNASYGKKLKGVGDSLYFDNFLDLIKKFNEEVPAEKISKFLSELFDMNINISNKSDLRDTKWLNWEIKHLRKEIEGWEQRFDEISKENAKKKYGKKK